MSEYESGRVPEMTPSSGPLRPSFYIDDAALATQEKLRHGQHQKLTARQQQFCEEYVVDLNGTQAAIRAGYSRKSAAAIAAENLLKLDVRDRIRQLLLAKRLRSQAIADKIVADLTSIAFRKKGQGTKDRLRAMDMLAKVIGLYELPKEEGPRFLPESELPQEGQSGEGEVNLGLREILANLPEKEHEKLREALVKACTQQSMLSLLFKTLGRRGPRARCDVAGNVTILPAKESTGNVEPGHIVEELTSFIGPERPGQSVLPSDVGGGLAAP